MLCPKCNGPMWDNRDNKKNPKAPDWKCQDDNCKWKMTKAGWEPSDWPTAAWEPKGVAKQAVPSRPQIAPQTLQAHGAKEDAIAKAVALKAAVESHAKGDPFDVVLGTANKYLEWLNGSPKKAKQTPTRFDEVPYHDLDNTEPF